MTKRNPYEKLTRKKMKVTIGGEEIPIEPKVKDYGVFMAMGKTVKSDDPVKQMELEEKKIEKLNDTLVEIYYRPIKKDYERPDIEAFVMQNYIQCLQEAFIEMGLGSRKDFEQAKETLPLGKEN